MTTAHAPSRRLAVMGASSLLLASSLATFTNAPGYLIGDARYEHYADPGQFLARHASLWDAERSLGEPSQYFSPVLATFQAGAQLVGADAWVIERLTHSLLLAMAGIGMLLLMRRLFADGWVAIAASFLYVFNPYTSQYLVPSGLFAAYTLAPWVVLFAVRGADGRDPWRWAAATAVAVFCMGMLNTPALILALIPVLVIVPFRVAESESASWASVARWGWRAVVLTAGISAAAVVVLVFASPELRFNVETTETPLAAAAKSSASESWRGLGFWLSYFTSGGGPLRDQAVPYFDNPVVIGASFAAPTLAGLALVFRRTRLTAGLAILAGVTVVAMVGSHPLEGTAPAGSALRWLFDHSVTARGFRSTYKAGVGLQLAVAALGGVGLVALVRAARRRPTWTSRAPSGVIALVLVAGTAIGAFPFWTGRLYDGDERMDDLPGYWNEAFSWFEAQDHGEGVLVLPSGARTRYRWGYVNDTLFDAHLAQPAVAAQTLPQSTDVLADLTESVDEYLSTAVYEVGVVGPWLRRMGVRWVLIQNDVDWGRSARPRPSTFDGIRADPDFALVASFGEPGLNVVPPTGLAPGEEAERDLPPIEVYEVRDPRSAAIVVPGGGVLVAGGGEAWPGLARAGWLSWPVTYTAQLAEEELIHAIAHSVALVVTDGGQRRATVGEGQNSIRSHVLSVDETTTRPARPLFADLDDQTIAVYPDLALVEAASFGPLFLPWPADARPANALDGEVDTEWTVDRRAADPVLRVELREPTDIRSLGLVPFTADPEAARVTDLRVSLTSDDGRSTVVAAPVDQESSRVDVALDVDDVTRVEVELGVTGEARAVLVGISELEMVTPDGLVDGREFLRVPSLGGSDALEAALEGIPVHYVFSRNPAGAPGARQLDLRREFWSPDQELLDVVAETRADDTTPDLVIDRLLGAEVGAHASRRFGNSLEGSGSLVLDDDLSTAWQLDASDPGELTLRLGGQRVDELEVRSVLVGALPLRLSRVTGFDVEVRGPDGSTTQKVSLPDQPTCDEPFQALDESLCIERVTIELAPAVADEIVVRPLEIDESSGALGRLPAQIEGVQVRNDGVDLIDAESTRPDSSCRALLEVDGVPIMMRPRGELTTDSLAAGLDFVSCEPISLTSGDHSLANLPGLSNSVSGVTIDPRHEVLPSPPTQAVSVDSGTPTSQRLTAVVEAGDLVVTDVPEHEGWKVQAEGVPGHRTSADGFVAWRSAGSGTVELAVDFGPQRTYKIAALISACTLAVCLWLLLPRRSRR